MASRTLGEINNDSEENHQGVMPVDNEDEATEHAGSNRMKNGEADHEILVKWQIPGHHDNASAKKVLITLLVSLLTSHPNGVTLIDRKQREWQYDESVDEEMFVKES